MSIADADRIAKMVPFELKMTIDKALDRNPKLKAEYENNPDVKNVIDVARRLEGMARHASTHAAGVVIADAPITDYVPLQKNPKDESVMTQYTMKKLESMGLLKMDFLGLRTLTVIRDAVRMIEENHGVKLDIERLDLNDKKVYELMSSGNTLGTVSYTHLDVYKRQIDACGSPSGSVNSASSTIYSCSATALRR